MEVSITCIRLPGPPTPRWRYCLSIQAGELILSVLLDTGRSPDLPTCGDGNRTRRHQNEIRDTEAVRVGYRRGDFTFDGDDLIGRILPGVAAVLEFDDGDELFGVLIGNRYRRAPAPRDLLDRRLDVVGRVITPIHDQKILDATHDEQLTVRQETQISGSQPRLFGRARRRVDKLRTKRFLGLLRFPPIPHC